MSDIPAKVSLSTSAVWELLNALQGPPHYIREIQATRGIGDNPLDILCREFNEQMKQAGVN
jgi:hypothetical protein